MANVDKAFGLRPYKGLNVGSAVQEANKYNINPSGYGTSIFQGDLVIFNGGYIERAAASSQQSHILDTLAESYYVNGLTIKALATAEKAMAAASGDPSYYVKQVERFRRAVEEKDKQ